MGLAGKVLLDWGSTQIRFSCFHRRPQVLCQPFAEVYQLLWDTLYQDTWEGRWHLVSPTRRSRVRGSRPELSLQGLLVICVPRAWQRGFDGLASVLAIVSLLRLCHASALLRDLLGSQ